MIAGMTTENREALVRALSTLAAEIEANPLPIIGSDIVVHAGPGASAIGSSISVTAGPGAGGGIGQRISVLAARPGQSVIGQRITVDAGSGPIQTSTPGASSQEEINDMVAQLREAAKALASSSASERWVRGILKTVSGWGSSALSSAVSGATNAVVRFYLIGG